MDGWQTDGTLTGSCVVVNAEPRIELTPKAPHQRRLCVTRRSKTLALRSDVGSVTNAERLRTQLPG